MILLASWAVALSGHRGSCASHREGHCTGSGVEVIWHTKEKTETPWDFGRGIESPVAKERGGRRREAKQNKQKPETIYVGNRKSKNSEINEHQYSQYPQPTLLISVDQDCSEVGVRLGLSLVAQG